MTFNFSRPPQLNNYRYVIHRNPPSDKHIYDQFAANNTFVFNPSQRRNIKSQCIKMRR